MDAIYHLLYLFLVIITFLFSMCGLLHRLRRQYDEHILALNHKNLANKTPSVYTQPNLQKSEACVINLKIENTPLDLPPKYEEIELRSANVGKLPAVHHI